MRKLSSATDPLWYKDAVIYELPVKAFYDSNNDGVGDFGGLLQKIDYLQELGVTCLWLLPFFSSPLRDDGYDVSDFRHIHPRYGTAEEVHRFLRAAHERGMQVMIEFVLNHTSDQHPWFQAARQAPPGSRERDYYVWSDTDKKFKDARIIFTDTEKSNWSWDAVARQYYWHRFFSHQPDLNYDNPEVVREVLDVMRFWLDQGVDGLRLDAIPYLVEREGTNCENLPETHTIVRQLRHSLDEHYANRMILAEANQWPSDVLPYFGQGDECHMAFHFPLMPRLFMALRLEDRHPITEVMSQTPDIPEVCQWALFLRNHDELTLEMVTDEERDYMYLAYSSDPAMRVNVGIRRRLAPLLDNNRLRIELLNSILFSFPGTPIIYYGDEIGMGDNIYLGDRDGVRTPMQWSGDRNAGFSRAIPSRLYSPVIMDPVYGYQSVNVEAQQGEPSSLLNWMRNMISLRKLFKVFGRGRMELLRPANRKVLAYLRTSETEKVLCVANLSRFAQPVELDLARFDGMVPVEMIGYVEFPKIRKAPYPLTLSPYGYLWFELQQPVTVTDVPGHRAVEQDFFPAFSDWEEVLSGPLKTSLEQRLPEFLLCQRWFGGKSKSIESVAVREWVSVPDVDAALLLVEVIYRHVEAENYFVPLVRISPSQAPDWTDRFPNAILAPCEGSGKSLCDATVCEVFCQWVERTIGQGGRLAGASGVVEGIPGRFYPQVRGDTTTPLGAVPKAFEQSNSSVAFGDTMILKLFRHPETGPNPDCEITQYLTESRGNTHVPKFCGALQYVSNQGEVTTLGLLQELVENQGDGWTWTLEQLGRYYESCSTRSLSPEVRTLSRQSALRLSQESLPADAADAIGLYLDAAATLARRTAELHGDLGADTLEKAFQSEILGPSELGALAHQLREHGSGVLNHLKTRVGSLPDELVELAGPVLGRRRDVLQRFTNLDSLAPLKATRVHGDYHLGQVLRVKQDFVLIDFEGEPGRSLVERRAKQSPVKDVAGMLRSFSYAAQVAFLNHIQRRAGDVETLDCWARAWDRAVSATFLRVYLEQMNGTDLVPRSVPGLGCLLDAFVLDKALYELEYELNNRPAWARIPLVGILSLLDDARDG